MYSDFVAWGYSKYPSNRKSSREVGVRGREIVRVHYFVRGGFVGHRSRASSKHLSPHLPVDELDSSGGQTGVALHLQDVRVGVGSTKKAD
ncbi:uncharacterized protein TNCV_4858941 [Trichonephila clavipes]|nr:uncharacterized protein TNCV_4858941 [Trichonephila clavipes]